MTNTKLWGVYDNTVKNISKTSDGPMIFNSRTKAREAVKQINTESGRNTTKVVSVGITASARNHAGEWISIQ